jgi:hypothetical protein
MAVSYRILSEHALVYVRYEGMAGLDDGFKAFEAYLRDPLCRPGQKQFIDLSGVTEIERDFPQLMAFQAFKALQFVAPAQQTLLVYFAPSKISQIMANLSLRSWAGFDHVAARMMEDEAAAMEFLGLRERRIAALLAQSS